MARIQWTPIVAPDIGSEALRAQSMAGASIQNAFSGFTGLLNDWEGSQREKNLAELFRRQNSFAGSNDVAGYQGDLADGDLFAGMKYLKAADLAAARNFTGDLRTGRQAEFAWDRSQITAGRDDRNDARSERDLESGVLVAREGQRIEAAVRSGQMTREQGVAAAAELAARTQNATQIANAYGSVDRGILESRGDTTWDRGTTQFNDSRQDRQWLVTDRENEQLAQSLALTFQEYGPNVTNEDLMASAAYKSAPVAARARALALLGRDAPITAAPAGGSFAGDASHPMAVLNYNARGGGFSSVPDSVQTYGQLDSFGTQMLRANGVSSSASGPFQITRDTRREFAPRALGANWQSLPPSIENDDKIAEAIFNDAKSKGAGAISGRWSAIDATEARRLMAMPWSQARVIIAQQEGGTSISPRTLQGQATDIAVGATVAGSTDRMGRLARTIVPALNNDTPITEVVQQLGTNPQFQGSDSGRLGRLIRDVQDRYASQNKGGTLSATAAANILVASTTPHDAVKDFWSNATGRSSGVGGSGRFGGMANTVRWNDVDALLGQLRPDGNGNIPLASSVRNQENRQAMIAGSQQGRAALEQTRTALIAQEARDVQLNQPNNPATARLRQQFQQLNAQWGSFAGDAEEQLNAVGFNAVQPPPRQPVVRGTAAAPVPIRRRTPVSPVYGD